MTEQLEDVKQLREPTLDGATSRSGGRHGGALPLAAQDGEMTLSLASASTVGAFMWRAACDSGVAQECFQQAEAGYCLQFGPNGKRHTPPRALPDFLLSNTCGLPIRPSHPPFLSVAAMPLPALPQHLIKEPRSPPPCREVQTEMSWQSCFYLSTCPPSSTPRLARTPYPHSRAHPALQIAPLPHTPPPRPSNSSSTCAEVSWQGCVDEAEALPLAKRTRTSNSAPSC